mmetsp:Transcript_5832/g.17241  ORF Transcript_5832/g.17241 Transcript_5832/m.17241 type:complete len:81 (+) Transcript_5832:15-257(+)
MYSLPEPIETLPHRLDLQLGADVAQLGVGVAPQGMRFQWSSCSTTHFCLRRCLRTLNPAGPPGGIEQLRSCHVGGETTIA